MKIKQDFENVVLENMPWVLRYVRSKVRNTDVAEDLTQEIFLKAFRAYDSYCDDGKIKPWLMRIAQNHVRNHFSRDGRITFISLDAGDDEEDPLYTYLPGGDTPEEEYLRKELSESVLSAVARLPERQRQIIMYRYIDDMKVSEISALMKIPAGTVKSAAHYALAGLRRDLGVAENKKRKGDRKMDCKDIYKYLFIYANGTISDENRKKVEEHIAGCRACADIVTALKKLIPTMTFGLEDEMTHFLIDFPELNISYCGMRCEIPDYERLNKRLEELNGVIPENERWFASGFGKKSQLLARFDNEGNEIEFRIVEQDEFHYEARATKMKKVFRYMWDYDMYSDTTEGITQSKEAPNLYRGGMKNFFGSDVKTALYQAIPGKAENVRIKRGNGVIDCGTYKFPYVDRYVTGDETISLDYSFNLEK